MPDEITWLEPFRPLESEGEEEALQRQLERELSPQHVLWGAHTKVIGRCNSNDDIVVRLLTNDSGDCFALVHLVWGTGPGDAEYPSTNIYNSAADLSAAIWREAVWSGFVDDFDANDPRLWERDEPSVGA